MIELYKPFLWLLGIFRSIYTINPSVFFRHSILIIASSLIELVFLISIPSLVDSLISTSSESLALSNYRVFFQPILGVIFLLFFTTYLRALCFRRTGYVAASLTALANHNQSITILQSHFRATYRDSDYLDVVENSTVNALNLCLYVVRPAFDFLYSSTQALAIIISIIVYSSSLAFISIALVLGYLGCIMLFVYPRISQVKLIIKKSQAKILNFSQSLLSSRRQIALSNPYGFSKEFENITDQWLKAHADNSFYSSIPRVFLELAVFLVAISVFIILVIFNEVNIAQLVTSISVLGVAGARFFSIAQQLFSSITTLKSFSYSLRIVDEVCPTITEPINCDRKNIIHVRDTNSYSLRISDLTVPSAPCLASNPVSLCIPHTGLFALHGPSGSGKSSLIDLLMGFNVNHAGLVEVSRDYISYSPLSPFNSVLNAAYCSSSCHFTSESIYEFIQYPIGIKDRSSFPDPMLNKFLSIACLSHQDGFNSSQPVSSLSQGQQQRLSLAAALSFQKPVLILDEALSSVDPDVAQQILLNLKSLSFLRLVILVTHRQSDILCCDDSFGLFD